MAVNHNAFQRFIHWITERHNIYILRESGADKPWTDDPILQRYFFTNPYRENDKVTKWFRENIRDPLSLHYTGHVHIRHPDPDDLALLPWATVAFRWFNYIPTGVALLENNLFSAWDNKRAKAILHERERLGFQIFTGAYMIKIENGRSKVDSCCDQITKLWDRRANFHESLRNKTTLEGGWNIILRIPFIGPFMAYEVITDLRHTPMFNKASDIMTWCNIGPGAVRGLHRLMHSDDDPPQMRGLNTSQRKHLPVMRAILERVNIALQACTDVGSSVGYLANRVCREYQSFEMRDLEHSLCEFDKYERARLNQGTMKRKYKGYP